jgi:hypothetical protein
MESKKFFAETPQLVINEEKIIEKKLETMLNPETVSLHELLYLNRFIGGVYNITLGDDEILMRGFKRINFNQDFTKVDVINTLDKSYLTSLNDKQIRKVFEYLERDINDCFNHVFEEEKKSKNRFLGKIEFITSDTKSVRESNSTLLSQVLSNKDTISCAQLYYWNNIPSTDNLLNIFRELLISRAELLVHLFLKQYFADSIMLQYPANVAKESISKQLIGLLQNISTRQGDDKSRKIVFDLYYFSDSVLSKIDFRSSEEIIKQNIKDIEQNSKDYKNHLPLDFNVDLYDIYVDAKKYVDREKEKVEEVVIYLANQFQKSLITLGQNYQNTNNSDKVDQIDIDINKNSTVREFRKTISQLIKVLDNQILEIENQIIVNQRSKINPKTYYNDSQDSRRDLSSLQNNLNIIKKQLIELQAIKEQVNNLVREEEIINYAQCQLQTLNRTYRHIIPKAAFQSQKDLIVLESIKLNNLPNNKIETDKLWKECLLRCNQIRQVLAKNNTYINTEYRDIIWQFESLYEERVRKISTVNDFDETQSFTEQICELYKKICKLNVFEEVKFFYDPQSLRLNVSVPIQKQYDIEDININDKILEQKAIISPINNFSHIDHNTSNSELDYTLEKLTRIIGYQDRSDTRFIIGRREKDNTPITQSSKEYTVKAISCDQLIKEQNLDKQKLKKVCFLVSDSNSLIPVPDGNYQLVALNNLTNVNSKSGDITFIQTTKQDNTIQELKVGKCLRPTMVEFVYRENQSMKSKKDLNKNLKPDINYTSQEYKKLKNLNMLDTMKGKIEIFWQYTSLYNYLEGLIFLRSEYTSNYNDKQIVEILINLIQDMKISYDHLIGRTISTNRDSRIIQTLDLILKDKKANCYIINECFLSYLLDIFDIEYRYKDVIESNREVIYGCDLHVLLEVNIEGSWQEVDAVNSLKKGDNKIVEDQIDQNLKTSHLSLQDAINKIKQQQNNIEIIVSDIKSKKDLYDRERLLDKKMIELQNSKKHKIQMNLIYRILCPTLYGKQEQANIRDLLNAGSTGTNILKQENIEEADSEDNNKMFINIFTYIASLFMNLPVRSNSQKNNIDFPLHQQYLSSCIEILENSNNYTNLTILEKESLSTLKQAILDIKAFLN